MLKDPDSIYPLGNIAVRKPLFGNRFELRKEAVKALGMIGSKKAVPYLTRVLYKKKLFGKSDNEELRLLAAIALGKIGGQDAIEAVGEAIEDSTGPLYTTCKRIVDGSK
jgi:HEAT repeat protein